MRSFHRAPALALAAALTAASDAAREDWPVYAGDHRGVAAWHDREAGAAPGALRIFINSRYRLIGLDAATGRPVESFGTRGVVDLTDGLSRRESNSQPALGRNVARDLAKIHEWPLEDELLIHEHLDR